MFDKLADGLINSLTSKVKADTFGVPKPPTAAAAKATRPGTTPNWGAEGSANKAKVEIGDKVWDFVDGMINSLVQKGLETFNLADSLKIGEDNKINPFGIAALKDYIKKFLQEILKEKLPTAKSNYALMMGGGEIIKGLIETVFSGQTAQLLEDTARNLVNLDTVVHNRAARADSTSRCCR